MKRYILTALTAIAAMLVQAQNPVLTTFAVEYTKANGNDTIMEVAKVGGNSFRTIGGKGIVSVYDPITGTSTLREESNQDLFIDVEYVSGSEAMVKTTSFVRVDCKKVGYCISKAPNSQFSDLLIESNSDRYDSFTEYADFSLLQLDGHSSYTLYNPTRPDYPFVATLKDLDYITTYYVRPYILFNNGEVMYGGEKSFTTLKTVAAAMAGDPELLGGYPLENGVVIDKEVMDKIWSNYEGVADYVKRGVQQDLKRFITDEIAAQLKEKSYKTITCVDGELYLVKEFSSEMINAFNEYVNGGVEFGLLGNLNDSVDSNENPLYTKNVGSVDTVFCDASLGVPYNTYITFNPVSASSNPSIAFDVPKYLKAGTYSIYAVFVHPDPVNDPRPNRFCTYMWETETDTASTNYGEYPSRAVRLTPPEGSGEGNDYITDISSMVDTLYIGDYTFKGAEKCMIQFVSRINSRLVNSYNRVMNISQVCIKPVSESEEQNTENQ